MKTKTYLLAIVSLFILSAVMTGCEDKVKIESLSNTYWEQNSSQYSYLHVWFFADKSAKVIIRTERDDDPHTTNCGWSCTQAGYVRINLFPGTSVESEWITGTFKDSELKLKGIKMTYCGKADEH